MKMSDFLFVVTILGLAFLFQGEPDVWDKLHADAMGKCIQPAKDPK